MQREPLAVLLGLALLAVVAAGSTASPSTSVKVHGPLDRFNMTNCFYRSMNITLLMTLRNWLSTGPPPECPYAAPVDGRLACTCSLEPTAWWDRGWSVELNPGESWSSTITTTVPASANLGGTRVGFGCSCSWAEWCTTVVTSYSYTTSTTTTTECGPVPPCEGYCTPVNETWTCCICTRYITSTTTTTTTTTTASTATARVSALENVKVLPRTVNQSYLPVDLRCSWAKPGGPGNCTITVYNLASGLSPNGTKLLPMLPGGLMLYSPHIEVWSGETLVAEWNATGYTWAAHTSLPDVLGKPVYTLTFTLPPPQPPNRTISLRVVLEATADNTTSGEAYRERLEYNYTIVYPYGWLIVVDDNCTIQRYEPLREPTVKTWVNDTLPPTYHAKGNTIVFEDPGRCGMLSKITIYRDGGVYMVYAVHSRVYRLDAASLPAGDYRVVAVDQAGHTVEVNVHVERPRQSLQPELILTLLVILAGLGVMTGRKWIRM